MRAEDYLHKAYRSILDNDFEQAIAWFEAALLQEPLRADIHYRLSITCARSDRLEKAMEHAARSVELDTEQQSYQMHYQRLRAKEMVQQAVRKLQNRRDDDIREAEAATLLLEQAVKLDPLSADIHVWLAIAYGELKKYHQALAAVWEASALFQDEMTVNELKKMEQRFKAYIDQTTN